MKKRNVMTMALSLALVGVIGVGGTLAYLSDTTGKVTNKFTMVSNGITLNLEETAWPGTGYELTTNSSSLVSTSTTLTAVDEGDVGFKYSEIQPNAVLPKDVKLKVGVSGQKTVSSYVFAMVDNPNKVSDFVLDIKTSAWKVVATEGSKTLYAYVGSKATEEKQENGKTYKYIPEISEEVGVVTLESVFTKVTVQDSVAAGTSFQDIEIKGYAAQVDNVTYATAFADAKTALGFSAAASDVAE